MLLRSLRLSVTAAALLFLTANASSAQGVKLEFLNGTVNLSAQNVPVRTILTEWARLGGTTIVGGDQVTGAPVSIELTGVPERVALDVVLREVPGYMLAARADVTKGASRFDRILVVATTATPRPAAGTTFSSAPPTFVPNAGGDQDALANERAEEAQRVRDEVQRARDEAMRRAAESARGIVTPGVVVTRPDAPPPFASPEPRPLPPAGPTPNNPFMPTPGSATPGTIAPVPQQQQPQSGPRPVQ